MISYNFVLSLDQTNYILWVLKQQSWQDAAPIIQIMQMQIDVQKAAATPTLPPPMPMAPTPVVAAPPVAPPVAVVP